MTAAPPTLSYSERLWFGPVGWISLVGFALVLGIAALPIDDVLALVVTVVALVVLVVLAVVMTTRVEVRDGTLHAGAARIPTTFLTDARVLDRGQMRTELGTGLDARAYLCTRGWVRGAVRVTVTDPADPTPYWIVSSRHPDALAKALATG